MLLGLTLNERISYSAEQNTLLLNFEGLRGRVNLLCASRSGIA